MNKWKKWENKKNSRTNLFFLKLNARKLCAVQSLRPYAYGQLVLGMANKVADAESPDDHRQIGQKRCERSYIGLVCMLKNNMASIYSSSRRHWCRPQNTTDWQLNTPWTFCMAIKDDQSSPTVRPGLCPAQHQLFTNRPIITGTGLKTCHKIFF